MSPQEAAAPIRDAVGHIFPINLVHEDLACSVGLDPGINPCYSRIMSNGNNGQQRIWIERPGWKDRALSPERIGFNVGIGTLVGTAIQVVRGESLGDGLLFGVLGGLGWHASDVVSGYLDHREKRQLVERARRDARRRSAMVPGPTPRPSLAP